MTGYINEFDEDKNKNKNTITMYFKVNNNKELLTNYNKIWKKNERLISINFDSKSVFGNDDKYIKNKNKSIYRQYNYKFL